MSKKNPAAVTLGSIKSPRKAASSRANGRKGGRPKMKRSTIWTVEMDTAGGPETVSEHDTEAEAIAACRNGQYVSSYEWVREP